MSITEWVISTYTRNTSKEINLEPAKNFSFIWSLFEHMAKQRIFAGELLTYDEFFTWVNSLKVEELSNEISITDSETGNKIDKELIKNIDNAYNHFYQKYCKNKIMFVDFLYNQSTTQVIKEKAKFEEFMIINGMNNIQNKICFLFFIIK